MNSVSLFRSLISRFGVEIVLVASLALGVFLFKNSNLQFNQNTGKSVEFRQSLEKIQQSVERAEASEREFLKSRKEGDLQEYNEQVRVINYQMGVLNRQVSQNPEQKQKVAVLNRTLHDYFENVNASLIQRQKGAGAHAPANASISGVIQSTFQESAPEKIWESYRTELLLAGLFSLAFITILSRYWEKKDLRFQRQKSVALSRKSILLDSILNGMSEALIVVDERGYFTHYNAAAQRIIGIRLKEISSEISAEELGFHDAVSGELLTLKRLPFQKALHGEQWDDIEIFVQNETHPSGTYISLSSRSLNDIDGHIGGALVVFKDVSRRKMVEQEWVRAREAAVEASLKKSDFLAAMSHEIRTPMNGVLGMTTLLADTTLNPEQKEYVGVVKRSAESLLMLINDILDYSKIEAGKINLHPQPFDLEFLCKDILEIFRPAVSEKNISLKLDLIGSKKWLFVGDGGRLRQVLVNLLGNAVKFTEKGSVTLEISQALGLDGKTKLRFEVKDTGPGLKEDERKALFQKYFQTKNGMKFGGTGLGLSISKQLVDLMAGEIGVESVVGLGSTFWFSVGLPSAQAHEVTRLHDMKFTKLFSGHVLLVEDQIVNQKVAETYLRKLGLQVDIAANGLVACEKFSERKYDLVFMDCQMPILNGFDATVRIRRSERGVRTPIIALTAESGGDKSGYLAAGMDDFLAKPLELPQLVATLSQWLPQEDVSLDVEALKKLENLIVKDQNLVSVLIDDLEQSAPDLIESMHQGVNNSDLETISQAAHALKSASATLGALKLSELCMHLEGLSQLAGAHELIGQVEEQLRKSLKDLKQYHLQKMAG